MAELNKALQSILHQSEFPNEIVIVDNSADNRTEAFVKRMSSVFQRNNIDLRYTRNKELSLTVSRNIGVKLSKGDIVFFMDDDVVLEKRYIKNILMVYEKYPSALGVEGRVGNWRIFSRKDRLLWFLRRLFFLFSFEANRCRVLTSGYNTYPVPLTEITKCQWLSGTSSYRSNVFRNFQFDERLRRWAFKEDVDFSYRIYKSSPGRLYITPNAIYFHEYSDQARFPKKAVRYMMTVYSAYFFYKNIKQTLGAKYCFALSLIFGFMVDSIMSRGKSSKYDALSIMYMLSNIRQIRKGDLRFFDDFLDDIKA